MAMQSDASGDSLRHRVAQLPLGAVGSYLRDDGRTVDDVSSRGSWRWHQRVRHGSGPSSLVVVASWVLRRTQRTSTGSVDEQVFGQAVGGTAPSPMYDTK
jgi:hypothetical protein